MKLDNLRKYIFVTDREFEVFFGAQIAKVKRVLDRYAGEICAACGGECCQRAGCGFYSVRFDSCPIYKWRPAKCRLYYCERVLESELLTQQERQLLGQRATSLSRILSYSCGFEILLQPPIRIVEKDWLATLGLEEQVNRIIQAFEDGELDDVSAKANLRSLVQRFRSQQ
jgi:hypothetical protein